METSLNNYVNNLTKTVNDVKAGVANIKIPTLDTDAVSWNEVIRVHSTRGLATKGHGVNRC